ncbi:hypothetical protein [Psychrobacter sp. JCM 18900]|uniref:hypothetical protein n=1 Tax=Psychrobacter sp. JCM 18900 TaxID=1298608 RepID=UPI0004B6081E|nr:hypothetical protein [Psychrobacter sp. JCM 18900]
MKPVCPRCQSLSVYEMTYDAHDCLIDELLSPTALIGLSISLCRTFRVHLVIGVITGTAIATLIEMAQSNTTIPMLVNKQYRCDNCSHVFTTFN